MNIAVLVSGGVDSSVALQLLHEQGHTLTAYYVKIWLEDELSHLGSCPWEEDLHYVRQVCADIQIPLEIVPLQKAYADTILRYTLDEIRDGYTPSPDIMCNHYIKFGAFREAINDPSCLVATGHYAKKIHHDGVVQLLKSPDTIKDQTYFLARLTANQLDSALFPLGDLTKAQVRSLAEHYYLPNRHRRDSQGICFLGKITFSEFLEYHLGVAEGPLIEYETGKRVGTHRGYWFYTAGQRQGIGLSGGPWYVVTKAPQENIVYISRNYQHIATERQEFWIRNVHWLASEYAASVRKNDTIFDIKLRHGPHVNEGIVHYNVMRPDWLRVTLAAPDQGLAPGQFAVLYNGDRCVGSGVIERNIKGIV